MRMQTATTNAPCGHGFASHAGFLFERQRTAMRQNAFARARSATTKRKARDSDDSDDSTSSSGSGDELQQQHQPKRVLLHGLKRMRVSSPPSTVAPPPPSPAASTSAAFGSPTFATNTATPNYFGNSTARRNAFTSAATSDIAMEDDDNDDTNTTDGKQAIVPANKPRSYKFATAWPNALHATAYTTAGALEMPPSDASCTALVLFGGTSSIPRNVSPRIELVESDDDETSDNGVPHAWSSDDNEDDSKPFVRFEEINDDDMEID